MKHRHHIVPKHMGGSDHDENLIELSVADHALAHLRLYEKYGKWQDLFAYNALRGKTDESEAIRVQAAKLGFQEFLMSDGAVEWRHHISSSSVGRKESDLTCYRKSVSGVMAWRCGKFNDRKKIPVNMLRENCKRNSSKMAVGRSRSKKWKQSVTSEEYKKKKMLADPRSTPIILGGIKYNSLRDAARNTEYSYYKIRRMVNKHGEN